jgi:hypothetical protein
MKTVISGANLDVTGSVISYLAAGNQFRLASLFMIGESDWPGVLKLTDYESPLMWRPYGIFTNAVIARGRVQSKVGLEVSALDIAYSPAYDYNVYKAILDGYFDNWPVRVWTAYMPTAGDAETYGCSELFGGRIGDTRIDRMQVTFTVNSFLDVVNQSIPNQVVELTNPLLAFESEPTEDWGFPYVPPPESAI